MFSAVKLLDLVGSGMSNLRRQDEIEFGQLTLGAQGREPCQAAKFDGNNSWVSFYRSHLAHEGNDKSTQK